MKSHVKHTEFMIFKNSEDQIIGLRSIAVLKKVFSLLKRPPRICFYWKGCFCGQLGWDKGNHHYSVFLRKVVFPLTFSCGQCPTTHTHYQCLLCSGGIKPLYSNLIIAQDINWGFSEVLLFFSLACDENWLPYFSNKIDSYNWSCTFHSSTFKIDLFW